MKHLFYVIIMFSISTFAYSQNRDIMSEAPTGPTCTYNSLIWKSEIQLLNSKLVHLRFQNDVDNTIRLRETSTRNNILGECTLVKNELMYHISNISKSYELVTTDDCNNEIILSVIDDSSRADFNSKTMEVSYLLSKVLKDFSFGNNRLCDVLANDRTTPWAEKISFYQKYKMKGRKFNKSFNGSCEDIIESFVNGGVFPNCDPDVGDGPGDGDDPDYECNCSVLRITPNHHRQGGISRLSGNYEAVVASLPFPGINQGVKSELSNEGETWQYYTAKGASTWHGLYTEGWKEAHGQMDSVIYTEGRFDDSNSTSLRGTLILHLICMDGNDLPSECECDKPIQVNFTYQAFVEAKAITHDVWFGDIKAKSCVQDMGVAYCFQALNKEDEGNIENIIPVAALNSRACASCEEDMNPEFFQNWRDLTGGLIDVFTDGAGNVFYWEYDYAYDSTLISIDTLQIVPIVLDSIYRVDTMVVDSSRNFNVSATSDTYKGLANDIFDVLTTSIYQPRDCGVSSGNQLKENSYLTTLKPNAPLTLGVMGMHRLMAGGQRAWYSHAAVATNFDLSVIIKPGDFQGPESGCCTPWVAGYILGTSLPGDRELYRSNVGNDIHGSGPFNYGSPNGLGGSGFGGWKVRGEMGYMTHELTGDHNCIPGVAFSKSENADLVNGSASYSDIQKSIKLFINDNTDISIYDLSGRQICKEKINENEYDSQYSLKNYLDKSLYYHPLGMYIVHISDGITNISFKHINRL